MKVFILNNEWASDTNGNFLDSKLYKFDDKTEDFIYLIPLDGRDYQRDVVEIRRRDINDFSIIETREVTLDDLC